jgi:hypothetical protein
MLIFVKWKDYLGGCKKIRSWFQKLTTNSVAQSKCQLLSPYLARIIHEITSEEQASPVVVRRAHHPEYIEGRPMGLYLEEVG